MLGAVFIALTLLLRPHPTDNGNTLVMLGSSPDHLDPALTYTAVTWQVMFNVYDGLLTYKRTEGQDGNTLIPDLAEAMPVINADGTNYKFTMRKGVKFGPPVSREVLPSDMKWAIERLYKIASPGGGFYMVIDGAEDMAGGKAKGIKGIVVDDQARTIEFRLTRPDATFNYKLAMMFSVAVPKEISAKEQGFDTVFVPATGPYMFKRYTAQRRVELVRNPNYKQYSPELPKGNVDKIDIVLGPAADNSVTKIRQGTADLSLGIPLQWLPRIKADPKWKNQIHKEIQASTSYVFMNTRIPPFDNVKVRQAVNYAMDRRALVKLQGGLGEATENIIPPLLPGYKKHNLYTGPDLKKARKLMQESGVKPGTEISFWCRAAKGPNPTAEYMQVVLSQLGFKVTLKALDSAVFFTTIGNTASNAQIGFNGWGADYPEAGNFIDVLLNGKRITKEANNNAAEYRGLDAEIIAADKHTDPEDRAAAWAVLDEKIMKDAPWAPYANSVAYFLTSKRVTNVVSHPTYGMILAVARVRPEKGDDAS